MLILYNRYFIYNFKKYFSNTIGLKLQNMEVFLMFISIWVFY